MKKLNLLLAMGVLAFQTNAQEVTVSPLVFTSGKQIAKVPVENNKTLVKPATAVSSNAANKTTSAPRWYSYFEDVDALNGQALQNNLAVIPTWFDTTIRQVFNTGAGTINYSAASLFIDPIRFDVYNDPVLHNGEMRISATDAYTVDSVRFFGVYEQSLKRPNSVVDTLIISVAPSTGRYSLSKTAYPWAAAYLPSGKDTLYAYTVFNVDSVNRAAFSDVTGTNRILWKVPLTSSMRDTGFNIKQFAFKVPSGGLLVPANNAFSVTVAFKSGDTWIKNVDTVTNFHRWMLLTGSTGTNAQMPYYYYSNNDRNMSNMMFSTDTGGFLPSVIIEGINTTSFRYEFHNIDAYILCPACGVVSSVNDVQNIGAVSNAFPNPAQTEVSISFTIKEASNVNVSIANPLGQVVKTQSLGKYNANQNGKAVFNISDLSNGIYFYTVEANGQRKTQRFVVAH